MAGWKKNRMSFKEVQAKTQEEKTGGYEKDKRMWLAHKEADGSGYAVIRFLPPAEGATEPWVKLFSHGFQGKGWYIENCPTTLGKDQNCPACEANREIVEQHGDGDFKKLSDKWKAVVRDRKRNQSYYSNVLVIEDSAHPENEGKVFIYRYGQKIFGKIMDAVSPTFADEDPINPFDFLEGANFKLKIRKLDGNVNYDKSEFAAPSELLGGDEGKLDAVYSELHDLSSLVAPDQFSSYEDSKKRINKVLGQSAAPVSEKVEEEESPWKKPAEEKKAPPAVAKEETKAVVKEAVAEPAAASDDEVDDAMAFFASIED